MITGYNTDVRHVETVIHVQTEDKGRSNPLIESVVYVGGRVVATKRLSYALLLEEGKGDPEIAALMDLQHRTVLAAIKAGRFDGKLLELKGAAGSGGATAKPEILEAHAQTIMQTGAVALEALAASLAALPADLPEVPQAPQTAGSEEADTSPTLDQVILDYLSTEAEHEQLVLALDSQEEMQPGTINNLTLRAYSSKSGLPLAGVQVSVKMLSTVADPRTLLVAETDDVGALEMRLDVPVFARGSAALIISGASDLGRAEIKQLL